MEPIRTGRTTDGHIITQSAAERAIIAIPQSSAAATAAAARKNVPKLLPMVPQGNKRGGGGVGGRQRVAIASPGTSGTGVPNIMENLGRIVSRFLEGPMLPFKRVITLVILTIFLACQGCAEEPFEILKK